jgi:arylsulfatase A-like enzyme
LSDSSRLSWARIEPSLRDGLVTGAVFSFLEILLLFGTGTVPWSLGPICVAFDLLAWSLLGVVLGLLGVALAPRASARRLEALVMLQAPVLIFTLRRGFLEGTPADHWWAPGTRWGTLGVLAIVLIVQVTRPGLSAARFAVLSLVSQSLAAAAVLARNLRADHVEILLEQGRLQMLAALSMGCAAIGLVAIVTQRRRVHAWQPRPIALGAAAATTSILLSTAIAFGMGTRPPELEHGRGRIGSAEARGPNVLLVTLDTVRRDHLSCYGYGRPTTRFLDDLARRATLFTEAYASSPYTLSSHASLFTGLLPSQHGAHSVAWGMPGAESAFHGQQRYEIPLAAGRETLAESLGKRGYRTGGIVANATLLGEWTGLGRGFEYYHALPARGFRYVPAFASFTYRAAPQLYDGLFRLSPRADEVVEQAILWLGLERDRPFFLFLNLFDAHDPYDPPPGYAERFGTAADERPVSLVREFVDAVDRGERTLQPEERRFLTARYDGEIAFADEHLGRLLEWLGSRDLLDHTLLVVTSDHGEFFGEHGLIQHCRALYEEVLQIPLIVKLPGQHRGVRIQGRVTLADVPAMVRRVVDGERDASALAPRSNERAVVAEYWLPHGYHTRNPERFHSPILRAVFEGNRKLIQTVSGRDELYDLSADPREQQNLLESRADWAAAVRRQMIAPFPMPALVNGPAPPLDPAVVERLKALGYIR